MTQTDKTMLATVVNYGIPETDKEHPQVLVEFSVIEQDGMEPVKKFWYGSLHPNAIKYTLEGLFACGLKTDDLSALLAPGALEIGRVVELVVGPHTYNGKTFERVKWVNTPGARRAPAKMDALKAKTKLSHLSAFVRAERQKYEAEREPIETDVPGF